jgi:hypothetical protein
MIVFDSLSTIENKVGLVFEKRTFLKMSKNEKPRWRILKGLDFCVFAWGCSDFVNMFENHDCIIFLMFLCEIT